MLDANLKIIAELKDFITMVTGDRELLNKFCTSESDFTRVRKLPFNKLVLLIAKLCKKTLSIELESFFKETGDLESCSVSAFTQQRLKLEPFFLHGGTWFYGTTSIIIMVTRLNGGKVIVSSLQTDLP